MREHTMAKLVVDGLTLNNLLVLPA
jgi:hypothetical protein